MDAELLLGEQTAVAIAKDTNNKDLIKNMSCDFSGFYICSKRQSANNNQKLSRTIYLVNRNTFSVTFLSSKAYIESS